MILPLKEVARSHHKLICHSVWPQQPMLINRPDQGLHLRSSNHTPWTDAVCKEMPRQVCLLWKGKSVRSETARLCGVRVEGWGGRCVYSASRSTATISCSVSADTVSRPFRRSVMGKAYARLSPTRPAQPILLHILLQVRGLYTLLQVRGLYILW